jgi:hypothetical protein
MARMGQVRLLAKGCLRCACEEFQEGKNLPTPQADRAKIPPDDFTLRQWRTLCRMVRDMEREFGLKYDG